MTRPLPTRFTADDQQDAYETWGANCGPGALAGICGLTLDEVRPLIPGFESKGYTNPTMMFDALRRLEQTRGIRWERLHRVPAAWPSYGLCRIQWEGPWTNPGVPARVAYGHTHWVGSCARSPEDIGVFDINCIANGTGWSALKDWAATVVPHLLRDDPKASGQWHITHAVRINLPEVATRSPSSDAADRLTAAASSSSSARSE